MLKHFSASPSCLWPRFRRARRLEEQVEVAMRRAKDLDCEIFKIQRKALASCHSLASIDLAGQ